MSLPKTGNKIFEQFLKLSAATKLDEFRQYTLEMESKFNIDKKALEDSYEERIKELSEEQRDEINDFFADDYYMIEEILIVMYRNSLLISLYSFLENSMAQLCRHLSKHNNYPIELSDLKDNGIVGAKIFLEKMAKVDFTSMNGEWSDLMSLNKIRNCIVHSEGFIKSSDITKFNNVMNQTNGVSLRDNQSILIERKYIDLSIDRIEKFLNKLYKQVFPNH